MDAEEEGDCDLLARRTRCRIVSVSATVMDHSRLIAHINRKNWWHSPPQDPKAYLKRGKFFASSFREAEFYGRPLDQPDKVKVSNPLVGDEDGIELQLLGYMHTEEERRQLEIPKLRFALDARLKRAALAKGYDSILLMTPRAYADYKTSGRLPRSMELNVLKPLATIYCGR